LTFWPGVGLVFPEWAKIELAYNRLYPTMTIKARVSNTLASFPKEYSLEENSWNAIHFSSKNFAKLGPEAQPTHFMEELGRKKNHGNSLMKAFERNLNSHETNGIRSDLGDSYSDQHLTRLLQVKDVEENYSHAYVDIEDSQLKLQLELLYGEEVKDIRKRLGEIACLELGEKVIGDLHNAKSWKELKSESREALLKWHYLIIIKLPYWPPYADVIAKISFHEGEDSIILTSC
jgi:hypothetical protein